MSRSVALTMALVMLTCLLPTSHAAEVEELDSGLLLGGLYGLANESIALNSSFAELPTIVEDYTATWCSNCVDVEEAMDEVALSVNMQIYAVHRNIYDPEDPLGTESVDQWFRDRYGEFTPWKPPIAGFNGLYAISGSKPVGDSLVADYTDLSQRPNDAGDGFMSMAWAPTGPNSGTITWAVNHSTDKTYNVSVWMVETMAYYPEGTNNQQYYPHVLREIIDVGIVDSAGFSTGTMDVDYANAYDDSDLEVHLVFEEYIEPVVIEEEQQPEPVTEDTPFIPMSLTVLSILAVALYRQDQ
jgi:thiol-disulfide isomerase/thioredoxin